MIETLVFQEAQITCPNNGPNPQWNGLCYALDRDAGRNVVIIRETDDRVGKQSEPRDSEGHGSRQRPSGVDGNGGRVRADDRG